MEDGPFKESHLVPYFLSLPESTLSPGKPGGLRELVGQMRFTWASALLRHPEPSACGCTTGGDCHLLAGATRRRKEAFKPLPAVGAAFWMNNNIDGGLPVTHEGGLELGGNFARVFQKGCVCC